MRKCSHCGKLGHLIEQCWNLKPWCLYCGLFGHDERVCWWKRRELKVKGIGEQMKKDRLNKGKSKAHVKQTHVVDEHSEEDAVSLDSKSDTTSWYDWLGNTCTSSHITNQRENFITFCPSDRTKVWGVGNSETNVQGCGTVQIESTVDGKNIFPIYKMSSTFWQTSIILWHWGTGTSTEDRLKLLLVTCL